MEHISRKERLCAIAGRLMMNPNQVLSFSQFCETFDAAKSSLSEDIAMLRELFATYQLGEVETIAGASGGVRYRARINRKTAYDFLTDLGHELEESSRLLPGGYLYTSDILSDSNAVRQMGRIIADEYYEAAPDFVLTMETKGIPIATMVSQYLNVPMVVARRTSKVYEGPAVSINYVSGSSEHIETMCLSRRAVKANERALIVDDFLKNGYTAKGMMDLMAEFDVEIVGSAFVIAREQKGNRQIHGEKSLLVVHSLNDGTVEVKPADWLKDF